MVYFLIGGQFKGNNETTLKLIKKQTGADCKQLKNESTIFKLGNLDQLMFMNDQLIKIEQQAESLLRKIERQQMELQNNQLDQLDFKINDQKIEDYLLNFKWSEQKYPRNRDLQNIIKMITERINQNDGFVKNGIQQLQEYKQQSNMSSKKGGNLMTIDLDDILNDKLVSEKDFIKSEYVQTLVAVVHSKNEEEFKQKYQLISEQIIPGSLKEFNYKDKEQYKLFRFMIFTQPISHKKNDDKKQKSIIEHIQTVAKDLKVIVREFDYNPKDQQEKVKKQLQLDADTNSAINKLKSTCINSFDEVYQCYIHLKMLRFTVDQSIRFGVTEDIFVCMLNVKQGQEKKVQTKLIDIFLDDQGQRDLFGTKEELEDTEDFFPFIYCPINVH